MLKPAIVQHLLLLKSGAQLLLQVLKKYEHKINRQQHLLILHTVALVSTASVFFLVEKKKDQLWRRNDVDLLSSSNTLCESVYSIFSIVSFMLLDIFFYDFLLTKRLVFCVWLLPTGSLTTRKNHLQLCWCFLFVFSLSIWFRASHVLHGTRLLQSRPDTKFSSSALKSSCLVRLQVDILLLLRSMSSAKWWEKLIRIEACEWGEKREHSVV